MNDKISEDNEESYRFSDVSSGIKNQNPFPSKLVNQMSSHNREDIKMEEFK